MSPKILTAPVLAMAAMIGALATPAAARDYPRITGGDDEVSVVYGPQRGKTIVGGAHASIQGGAGDQANYLALPGGHAREGRVAVMVGGGREAAVVYLDRQPHGWAATPADTDDRGHGG